MACFPLQAVSSLQIVAWGEPLTRRPRSVFKLTGRIAPTPPVPRPLYSRYTAPRHGIQPQNTPGKEGGVCACGGTDLLGCRRRLSHKSYNHWRSGASRTMTRTMTGIIRGDKNDNHVKGGTSHTTQQRNTPRAHERNTRRRRQPKGKPPFFLASRCGEGNGVRCRPCASLGFNG